MHLPKKFLDGDKLANLNEDTFFTDLWHKNYRSMRSHAYHQLYNREMAGDAVSEAFTRCIKYMNRTHPKPGAWLMLTLNNICLEMNIKELRQQMVRSPPPQPSDPGLGDLLPSALRGDDAELLTLFYVERRTLAEIADVLHTTPAICKKRLYRARQRLKRFLEEGRDTDGPDPN